LTAPWLGKSWLDSMAKLIPSWRFSVMKNRFTKLKFPGTLNDFQYWTERVTIHGLTERPKSRKNNPGG
jgi:hypothetical protein